MTPARMAQVFAKFAPTDSGEVIVRQSGIAYDNSMETNGNRSSDNLSLEDAKHLQQIENNPLSNDEVAMFEMFERESWSADRRRTYILEKIRKSGETTAAE